MNSICFYFQVHQPYRLKDINFFDIGYEDNCFDSEKNLEILNKVSEKCYLPANQLFLELIEKYQGEFKIAFSLSGVFLEQCETWRPDVLASFQKLVDTGHVEILAETYYHSLSYLYSEEEFVAQVQKHNDLINRLFGVQPVVFRNTELIYNNQLAHFIKKMGYQGIIAEGVDHLLGYQSPNFIHHPPGLPDFPILLKNYKLSDDIAFRFSNKGWDEHPLSSEKFASWVHRTAGNGEVINLFMDYETFGEHQWEDTGIFEFLNHLPEAIFKHPDFKFHTPSELINHYPIRGTYDAHEFTSWADAERDLSAWRSNSMQYEALRRIFSLETVVKASKQKELLEYWRRLTTSDHFYYICTKFWSDGDVHKYFSPFDSPLQAYNNFINTCADLEYRLSESTRSLMLTKVENS